MERWRPVFPADSFEEARLKGALGAAVETAVEALPALMLLDMRLYPALLRRRSSASASSSSWTLLGDLGTT